MVFCAVRFSTAGKPETKAKQVMTLESVTSTLEERGIALGILGDRPLGHRFLQVGGNTVELGVRSGDCLSD